MIYFHLLKCSIHLNLLNSSNCYLNFSGFELDFRELNKKTSFESFKRLKTIRGTKQLSSRMEKIVCDKVYKHLLDLISIVQTRKRKSFLLFTRKTCKFD